MIRINLLPVKETQKQIKGRQQLLFFLALVVLEAAVLFYFTQQKQVEVNKLVSDNKKREQSNDLKNPPNMEKLRATEKALQEQQVVLQQLSENQIGPVKMLNELSVMTTTVDDALVKVAIDALGWNKDWDASRLWVDTFVEEERRVTINGYARSNNDVAEFYRRLNNSKHFAGFQLNVSEVVQVEKLKGVSMVRFTLEGLALYGPADELRFFGPPPSAEKAEAGKKSGEEDGKKKKKKKGRG